MRPVSYLNAVLTVIAFLLAGLLWTAWSGPSFSFVPSAQAQGFDDPGTQRAEQINQLKILNQGVKELAGLFRTGQARVRLEKESGGEKRR